MRIQATALLIFVALASTAQATNFEVTTIADNGVGSFRQAISDSNSPAGGAHTITFGAGFPDNGVVSLETNLPLIAAQSLTIVGGNKLPTLDGQSVHQILRASDGMTTLALSDMILSRGFAPEHGGCISAGSGNTLGTLQAERVTFVDCEARGTNLISGGAISWTRNAGTILLFESRLLGNTVTATDSNGQSFGGALYTTSNVIAQRSSFVNNAALAPSGGGVGGALLLGGNVRSSSITESTFRFNEASPGSSLLGYGGAIALSCDGCTVQIVRSYLHGNVASQGGAVYGQKSAGGAADVYVTLTNSTFFNNSATNAGGSVWISRGAGLTASNNTMYNGDAVNGAHFGFGASAQVNYFRANLLAPTYSGSACSGSPAITDSSLVGFNLLSDTSCSVVAASSLANTPLGTVSLDERAGQVSVLRFSGSAVVDSINNAAVCEPRDARFQARPIDGDGDGNALCDVGAYEDPYDIIFQDQFEV